jgi:hypothetical protein
LIRYKIYSHYHHDGTSPIWFVIDVKESKIDWNTDIFHVSVQLPYEELNAEEFDPYDMNLSVTMDDLTLGTEPNQFGIDLNRVKTRIKEYDANPNEVSNFVLLTQDVAEVLDMTI